MRKSKYERKQNKLVEEKSVNKTLFVGGILQGRHSGWKIYHYDNVSGIGLFGHNLTDVPKYIRGLRYSPRDVSRPNVSDEELDLEPGRADFDGENSGRLG